AVRACVEAIAAGEIFQANICTRFAVPFHGDPADVFAAGVQRFTPARAAFLTGDWGALGSLSPELFLARHGDVVTSSPIKGTLPRRGPADDGNAARLRSSAKDVAENVMIVDMARNDLGRVARTGTVTTPALLDVQPHPGVWHLVSDVRAELPPELPNSALLEAAFPPASVTGAPKPRALEIIAELEEAPRDVYCGAIGMVSPIAGLELNVAIRTLELADGQMQLGVGGGVTADSDPEQEWQECLTKASPVLSLLEYPYSRAASTASYSSFLRTPNIPATSATASLSRSPAAVRCSTWSTSWAGSLRTGSAPASTTVSSPRTPSAAHSASSPSAPRRISS